MIIRPAYITGLRQGIVDLQQVVAHLGKDSFAKHLAVEQLQQSIESQC